MKPQENMTQNNEHPKKKSLSSPTMEKEAGQKIGEEPSPDQPTQGEQTQAEKPEKEPNPIDKLKESIQTLTEENEKIKEMLKRERAEFINYRKRAREEQKRQVQLAIHRFLKDFLEVFDQLDLVLKHPADDSSNLKDFVEGVRLIQKAYLKALEKHHIHLFDPVDQEFDPNSMEALQIEEVEDADKEIVAEVLQKGFYQKLDSSNLLWIRQARVKVRKPKKNQQELKKEEVENE